MNCSAMRTCNIMRRQRPAISQTRKLTKDTNNKILKIILKFPGSTNFSTTHINAANDVLSILYSKDIRLSSAANLVSKLLSNDKTKFNEICYREKTVELEDLKDYVIIFATKDPNTLQGLYPKKELHLLDKTKYSHFHVFNIEGIKKSENGTIQLTLTEISIGCCTSMTQCLPSMKQYLLNCLFSYNRSSKEGKADKEAEDAADKEAEFLKIVYK